MLITLNELKTFLNIETAETGEDTILTSFITQSQNLIESYLNYTVESASNTAYIIGNNSAVHCFGFVPVTAISSISRRKTPLEAWETVSSSKYSIYELNGLYNVYYDDVFDYAFYRIIYTQGYSTVPHGIKQCCIELSANMYKTYTRGNIGISSEIQTNGGAAATTAYKDVWASLMSNKLSMYRLQTI